MTSRPLTEPLIPNSVRRGVVGFLAILALLAFVAMYLTMFYYTLGPFNDKNPEPHKGLDNPQLLSISTGLISLVGCVVAVALAQQQQEQQGNASRGGVNGGNWFTRRKLVRWFF